MPTALITGGSMGLGKALARALVDEGWDVVTDARDATRLAAATSELAVGQGTIRAVPGDVTDEVHRAELVTVVGPHLDLLVNNASTLGASPLPRLDGLPLDVLRTTLEVNLVAPLALIQAFGPALDAADGIVVSVTSDAAVEAYEGWGGYGSSKAALDQLTAVLAAEHPERRVYAVDPGDLRTAMHQDAFPGDDISDRPLPATVVPGLVHLLAERPPSGRYRLADLVVGAPG